MAKSSFKWSEKALLDRFEKIDPKTVGGALYTAAAYQAPIATRDMRRNATWKDRTGNARNGLMAKAFHDKGRRSVLLVLFHRVPYGVWLEVRWSGRYAIIGPTLRTAGDGVIRAYDVLMKKVFGL